MDTDFDFSSCYGVGCAVRTQEWLEIDEMYTQGAGNTYGYGKFMDETVYGQVFKNGSGIAFDFDF